MDSPRGPLERLVRLVRDEQMRLAPMPGNADGRRGKCACSCEHCTR
jgi:hypothetical protein